jgi:hypothetical protein
MEKQITKTTHTFPIPCKRSIASAPFFVSYAAAQGMEKQITKTTHTFPIPASSATCP